jgi:hypothetical protein
MKTLHLTDEQHEALTTLLTGGCTGSALIKLGLVDLQKFLRCQYADVYKTSEDTRPDLKRLSDYGCYNTVK